MCHTLAVHCTGRAACVRVCGCVRAGGQHPAGVHCHPGPIQTARLAPLLAAVRVALVRWPRLAEGAQAVHRRRWWRPFGSTGQRWLRMQLRLLLGRVGRPIGRGSLVATARPPSHPAAAVRACSQLMRRQQQQAGRQQQQQQQQQQQVQLDCPPGFAAVRMACRLRSGAAERAHML
eukprot:COSAG01_NODE_3585_length_5907_cov_21.750689_4_plen_176_part_00